MNNCSAMLVIVIVFAIFSVRCAKPHLQPVPVESDDICDNCQMTILDPEFAAEALMDNGEVKKFDTPICMVQKFSGSGKGMKPHIKKLFVTDFNSRCWISADSAFYISGNFRTPVMGYNVVVVSDSHLARLFCSDHKCDRVMQFRQFWTQYAEPDAYISLIIDGSSLKSPETFTCNLGDIVQVRVKNEKKYHDVIFLKGYEQVRIRVPGSGTVADRFLADRPGDFFDIVDSISAEKIGRLVVRGAHLKEEEKEYYEW